MRVNGPMGYFNEYVYHQVIDSINAKRLEDKDPVITVSKAKKLRKNVLGNLKRRGYSMGRAGTSFIKAVNEELYLENGEMAIFESEDVKNELYQTYAKQFEAFTGLNKGREDAVLPLSPYEDRFANRSVFRKNGSKLLFAKSETLMMPENLRVVPDRSRGASEGATKTVFDEVYDNDIELFRLNNEDFVSVGRALVADDLSGMTRLMPYMSEKDYSDVVDWVNRAGINNYMTEDALNRSVAVLEELQNSGTPYTIKRDTNIGQIKADLTGTKISVRLTDTKENESYIGRVYDNGLSIYYTTNRYIGRSLQPYNNPTAEECVNLLKFAQGKTVMRSDINEPIGRVRTYGAKRTKTVNGSRQVVDVQKNEAYHVGKNYSTVVGPYREDSRYKTLIHVSSARSRAVSSFRTPIEAESYLQESVRSARENFTNSINLNQLVDERNANIDDPDYTPSFSGDRGIAAIQQSYWEILSGRQVDVLKPGLDVDEFDGQTFDINNPEFLNSIYHGSPEDKVRQHLLDNTDYLIGSYELDSENKRFDPVNVASYMTSGFGKYRNNDDIIEALRIAEIDSSELKGNDFYNKQVKDRLIKFDEGSARPMASIPNPFIQSMYDSIKQTILETGCLVDDRDILFDANGIVKYTARKIDVAEVRANGVTSKEIQGEIGQIFIPDDMSLVETQFNGSDNYLFTPGYEAYVVPNADGEEKSLEERTRLRGYEQIMKDNLQYQLRSDLMEDRLSVGAPTSVNGVYRRLYDVRYPIDYITQAQVQGMSEGLMHDIIRTNASRVRYGNEFKNGSTINADYLAGISNDFSDPANDNFSDYYKLTGGRNMAILSEESDGYFDPIATGNSTNQGITRYLVKSAVVNSDGSITRGDLDDTTYLMSNDICKFVDYNPFDRGVMTFNNNLKASSTTDKVKMAQMTFGGWTFDDGYVVSKEFANNYLIRGIGNEVRPLMKGDKISDQNGNKGVISLVVDPDMDLEEAKSQGIEQPVAWFKANKGNLDIVGAPFSAVSRFNGGTARECMENPSDLVSPDGKVFEGCVGESRYTITHMPVDEKTHIYGEDELAQGKGRKASAQLAWAFASKDATEILKECYGSNNGATANLREMLITTGLDMDETGTLKRGYTPHYGEDRQIFEVPELEYITNKAGKQRLDKRGMKAKFGDIISDKGGFLEIPFALKYPTGDMLSKRSEIDGASGGYLLPIMSSHLRSGQEFVDGTNTVHDYTNQYLRIYEATLEYHDAQKTGNQEVMRKSIQKAQADYDNITNDLKTRKFEGKQKHNIFRDDLMSNRMPHSATAVWTADPRIDIDQIAVNSNIAKSLGVKDDDHILIWRDPILRDAGVRYMRVKTDETLTGVAINPAMDKTFDGDFDGDSVGLLALQTKAAKKEAMEKFSVPANLLDFGTKNKEGLYGVTIQTGLDLKSAAYENPDFAKRLDNLEENINKMESIRNTLAPNKLTRMRQSATKALNGYVLDSFENEYGNDMVSYKDMKSHIASLEHMVLNGAKGSHDKLQDYGKYLGIDEFTVKDGKIDLDTVHDVGHSRATRGDHKSVAYAQAVKSHGTGIAGAYSQRAFSVLRNESPKAILELTAPVTHSTLQSKHNPIEAAKKYGLLMSATRDLWKGRKMTKNVAEDGVTYWKTEKNDKGFPIQASPDEFKKQFVDVYTHKDGLNVSINEDYVDEVAKKLTTMNQEGRNVVMNIETDAKEMLASPMDKLAYGGDFDVLCEMAKENRNLFEGKYNQYFAPRSIIMNSQSIEKGLAPKAIIKSDTKYGFESAKKDSNVTIIKQARKGCDLSGIQENQEKTEELGK